MLFIQVEDRSYTLEHHLQAMERASDVGVRTTSVAPSFVGSIREGDQGRNIGNREAKRHRLPGFACIRVTVTIRKTMVLLQ